MGLRGETGIWGKSWYLVEQLKFGGTSSIRGTAGIWGKDGYFGK